MTCKMWSLPLIMALFAFTAANAQISMQTSDPARYATAHGRRAWVGGYANAGLEIWAGAVQIATDVRPEFRREGDVTAIPGVQVISTVNVEPTHLLRTYTGPDFSVDEEIWVPFDSSASLLRYTVHSSRAVQVVVRFRPSLNLMWPAALGGQEIRWDASASGYTLGDSSRQLAAVVLAPGATSHDEPLNSARALPQTGELAIALDSRTPQILFARVHPGKTTSVSDGELGSVQRLLSNSDWQKSSRKHYDELLTSRRQIETPDVRLNQALQWALVALDQDWVCNDDLGCGYVGGFGPSRRNRRPQYAWFFAGDGMIAFDGALASGDFERAREEIRFIAKYQDAQTGMIWHELTQSAPYLDWNGKYPYMFVHADLTYPYISTVAKYVRATNDHGFLRDMWPSVQKAFEYGRALVSDDGLPRIPAGKSGGDEQNALADELGLSASWVTACGDYLHLAELMGAGSASREVQELAAKARSSFAKRYWDAQKNFAIQGYRLKGQPMRDRGLAAIGAVNARLFNADQSAQILDDIAGWRFQSDWGTRSVAEGEPGYDPTGYAHGSVWALGTARVAEAYWAEHRPDVAWQVWRTLIPWSSLDSPGHMHEVLAGDTYHPQLESVPEQTWSSAGFLSGAVEGLFGLEPDAESGVLKLSPHLPSDWDRASIRNIVFGGATLSFTVEQTLGTLRLKTQNDGPPVRVVFQPRIPLGATAVQARAGERSIPVKVDQHAEDLHAVVPWTMPHGAAELTIRYGAGVAVSLPMATPSLGHASSNMKLTSISLHSNLLELGLDTTQVGRNTLLIRAPQGVQSVSEGTMQELATGVYEVTLPASKSEPDGASSYEHRTLKVTLAK